MDIKNIISFFDSQAPVWDEKQLCDDEIIAKILMSGGIREGSHVLDVACGTGVLFPYYERLNAASVTGVDISPEMVKTAKRKFPNYNVICADAQTFNSGRNFDAVMIYNAFPHFINPAKLIENLAQSLQDGGRLTIAHSMSREKIEKCHSAIAEDISLALPCEDELSELLRPYFDVDVVISDSHMFMVSGIRKCENGENLL